MLWKASGAEEAHAEAGVAIGLWYGADGIAIENTKQYTGNYCYQLDNDAVGGTTVGPEITQAWWSFEFSFETIWGDGGYYYLFRILDGAGGIHPTRHIGWAPGVTTSQARLALFDDELGTILAQSSAVQADQLDLSEQGLIKIEYDDGEWTAWGKFDSVIGWVEQFTYSDSPEDAGSANVAITTTSVGGVGTLTDTRENWTTSWVGATITCNGQTMVVTSSDDNTVTGTGDWSAPPGQGNSWIMSGGVMPPHVHQHISISSWTDETKGAGFFDRYVDDLHCWDNLGDNWKSRIATMSDFPRISVAHVPDDDAVWVALDAVNHATHHGDLDEIPPDHASMVNSDEADYFTSVGDLYDTTDTALLPDLSEETIQALLVTHAGYDSGTSISAYAARFKKYNVYEDGTLFADSEEDGRELMQGAEALNTARTSAGYYPWTPGEDNWTETNFNACEYGIDLIDGVTDQMTVQVIFFGTGVDDWEWTPPAGAVTRRIFIT